MAEEKYRVVAVDDDKDLLHLVHLTLDADYEVITISDPAKALASLEYIEPDFVLLDVMMPKITGYHILETLRKDPHNQQVQVIVVSAKDSPHDMKYAYKLGANFYLPKPFQPERARRALEMLKQQSGMGHPRKKLLSRRDVELRLSSGYCATTAAGEQQPDKTPTSPGMRLRRPLAEEEPGDEEKNWVG